MEDNKAPKQTWQKWYSIVLIANAIYFFVFYLITKSF